MCHRCWSQFAADCSRTTRRNCPLIARLAGRLQLKARSQRRYVPSMLVAVCSRLQQNNSTELPVDCKAGGPSAAEGTEPAPLCAIDAGRSLQQIAAEQLDGVAR